MPISFRSKLNIGFVLAIGFLAAISALSYRNTNSLIDNAALVAHTEEVGQTLEDVLSTMKDLETGQRGFVLTGSEEYLQPYQAGLSSIDGTIERLRALTADNESQQQRVHSLQLLKEQKIAELGEVIQIRKERGLTPAIKRIMTNVGKTTMDRLRGEVTDMRREESRLLALRNGRVAESTAITMRVILFGGIFSVLALLAATAVVNISESQRNAASRQLAEQNRVREGLLRLGEKMGGEQNVKDLARNVIETVADFVKAHVGSIYLADEHGALGWAGGYAFDSVGGAPLEIKLGEGLVGQAAAQRRTIAIEGAPAAYLKVRSSLGEAQAAHLRVVPFQHDGAVKGVVEVGSFSAFADADAEYLQLGLDSAAVAFNSAQIRAQVASLLEETQAQAEELQVQQEELKASNEELHSKTHELETQQEELKQTNEELEEQRTALEEQTERLEENNREIQRARRLVEEKASEVERASRYKSEFLANMSHELRTPLNSILLLSKSMEENTEGNLTGEQREICRTVHSSGVDLLSLINDILDLSKVEAGKLDVKPADVAVAALAKSMENQFRAQMDQKGLAFSVEVSSDCPLSLHTDRLRVEQILKNFLSNSLKFTSQGKIILSFARPAPGTDLSASGLDPSCSLAIAVADTGIGIPDEKKGRIFEAFEQVDSASSRKFGGAGLGLTIARKIAQLLGGEIQMESAHGRGSRFVVIVPEQLREKNIAHAGAPPGASAGMEEPRSVTPSQPRSGAHGIEDDRLAVGAAGKAVLIIEDDPKFAKILHRYCRDRGFRCLLAADGESGLLDASELQPSAILLDLRLPGMSGMNVLGALKGNAKTRHIPVHVMSVDEREADVLKLGAIGFLAKPATRDNIELALKKIEGRLQARPRKVLVVEDNTAERERILRLIAGADVEATGVGAAAEAIACLRAESFDCMILDLRLPDMSGFELLAEVEKGGQSGPPPVIVHTAGDLTKEELEKLQRFSQSIIIKGARSEERLLDEVTLFLHRVESALPQEARQILERVRHRDELFEGKKLLVADDDMRNVFALRSIFSKKGFQIVVAKNGKEALERIQSNPDIDLVLMDIMMPEMDGYEAIRQIRAEPKHAKLPIIALTAKAMTSDREKCLEAGANDYLPKPLDMDHLLSLLRVWLSR